MIPNDFLHAADSVNNGVPILKVAPQSGICISLLEIAKDLSGVTSHTKEKSFFEKLFN